MANTTATAKYEISHSVWQVSMLCWNTIWAAWNYSLGTVCMEGFPEMVLMGLIWYRGGVYWFKCILLSGSNNPACELHDQNGLVIIPERDHDSALMYASFTLVSQLTAVELVLNFCDVRWELRAVCVLEIRASILHQFVSQRLHYSGMSCFIFNIILHMSLDERRTVM